MDAQTFGQRLREAREQRGLSQDELAARIGKDQRAVSEYELGKRRMAAIDLPVLARELGVTVAHLFAEASHPDELDAVLLTEFRRLPNKSAKRAVIEIVRAFSDTLAAQMPDEA